LPTLPRAVPDPGSWGISNITPTGAGIVRILDEERTQLKELCRHQLQNRGVAVPPPLMLRSIPCFTAVGIGFQPPLAFLPHTFLPLHGLRIHERRPKLIIYTVHAPFPIFRKQPPCFSSHTYKIKMGYQAKVFCPQVSHISAQATRLRASTAASMANGVVSMISQPQRT